MWQLPALSIDEILIYLRKSRADDPLLSDEEVLAKHEQMLNDWVERNLPDQGKIPEQNRFREVVSGETLDSRPGVQAMLRKAESPKIKAVLVVEPQRLSRGSLEDIGRLVKLLRYSNTIVITLQYTYDLRDDRDRELFERELMRGNEFLEYQKRIMNNGRILAVQNGAYLGSKPPYGYKRVLLKEGKSKCHTLEPIPEEAEVVKQIFEMYRDGLGIARISQRLHDMGIKPASGKYWADTTLRNMLKNEHYVGKVRWFYTKHTKTVEEGEVIDRRVWTDDYLTYPGKHPAVISQELFDAVQNRIAEFPRTGKRKSLKNPFAGILYCECGRVLVRQTYSSQKNTEPRYWCRHQTACRNSTSTVSEVTQMIIFHIREHIADLEVLIERDEDLNIEIHRQAIARLEKRLEDLTKLEVSQWEKYTLEGMPKSVFDTLNEKVITEKAEVQQALCVAKDSVPEPLNIEEKIGTLREAVAMLESEDPPIESINRMLKECIKRITYSRKSPKGKRNRYDPEDAIHLHFDWRV